MLDASALALAVAGKSDAASALRARLTRVRRHAPHLIDAEVGNVLRRHERDGRLGTDEAADALRAAMALIDDRYPHTGPLAQLAWTFRHNLSFYDALYVGLAASLQIPLLTADGRLARAPGMPCAIELV